MSSLRMQTNTLRFNTGGNFCRPASFYNGSVIFERNNAYPRIFPDLQSAVTYFEKNTLPIDRCIGQFVTLAEGNLSNWDLYVYLGPDISDENYRNPVFWKRYADLVPHLGDEIQEVLLGNDIINEELLTDNNLDEILQTKTLEE